MKKCVNCGASIAENAVSCEYCGTKFEIKNSDNEKKNNIFKFVTVFVIGFILMFFIIFMIIHNSNESTYTYKTTSPKFSTQDIITIDFVDFTITYPKEWEVVNWFSKEEALKNEQGDIFQLKWPGDLEYYTNLSIIYGEGAVISNVRDIDNIYGLKIVENYNTNDERMNYNLEKILYGKFGTKEAAMIYIVGTNEKITLNHIILYFPLDNKYYTLVFNVLNNQGKDDITAIINSITFK